MTGYTVHTGTSKKYAEGWDAIFGGRKSGQAVARKSKSPPKKKSATRKRKKS